MSFSVMDIAIGNYCTFSDGVTKRIFGYVYHHWVNWSITDAVIVECNNSYIWYPIDEIIDIKYSNTLYKNFCNPKVKLNSNRTVTFLR